MSKMLYSIKDTVAEEFATPFIANTDGVANRMFQSAVAKTAYPTDFELYQIGIFDPNTGNLGICTPIRLVKTDLPTQDVKD